MRCSSCKYWLMPNDNEYFGNEECAAPRNPLDEFTYVKDMSEQRKLFGYATCYCRHPNVRFFERPNKNGACVVDGSKYMASLITGEDFGCTLHESI